MISFYELVFPDVTFDLEGNTQVHCPFPHTAPDGTDYYEDNPSAGIKLSEGLFHCFSCGRGYNETQFTANYLGTSEQTATQFLEQLQKSKEIDSWQFAEDNLKQSVDCLHIINRIGISDKVQKELHLGYKGDGLCIPVVLFNRIFDVVTYRPGKKPKYIRRPGSMSGLIVPFDLWAQATSNKTIICAGEKDMLIARSLGFNAITFTGGELTKPSLFLPMFINKDVYIIYDNDPAGKQGARNVAIALKPYAKRVFNVDLSNVCIETGEDLWDFFRKYGKTKKDLIEIMKATPQVSEETYKTYINTQYPLINLHEATTTQYLNKTLRSNIQVVATHDTTFSIPTYIVGTKGESNSEEDILQPGTIRQWNLNEKNYKDIFYLIDSNLKESKILQYIKTNLLNIPRTESNVTITQKEIIPIYKCVVTDVLDQNDNVPMTEFTAYSTNKRLENGKKYTITYQLVPHPQDGRKLMMVIQNVEESDDFIDNFVITEEVKESLAKFQTLPTKLSDKMNELINKVRGIIGANYNQQLLEVIDLWFHASLQFKVGNETIRGYLDTIVITESRVGKSSTVVALQKTYGVGHIVSLAGKSATIAGLIGGSNKVSNGAFQTRAGIIPQNHKGGIIFEELGKCASDITKEITEIRSSNVVRITRVSGTLELPAYVRMLSLSNPKTINGTPKPINQYPNGIAVLATLIETPEDIARYDLIAIIGEDASPIIDPYYQAPMPLPQIDYQRRIRWIWSRKPEQIIISQAIYQYTIQKSNELNEIYDTYIKIFGIETWKKILRLAVAIAGYVVSTDLNFETIIVEQCHIDKAIKILIKLYDNKTFKLRQFVQEERKYKTCTEEDIAKLQDAFNKAPILINVLENTNSTTRANLYAISGLDNVNFNRILNELVGLNFLKISTFDIIPTEKFFFAVQKINKSLKVQKEVILHV